MASTTDNFNLDLYETGDPANLNDQYNSAMHIIDDTMLTLNNNVGALTTRLTNLGATDDDTATALKNKWDTAANQAAAAYEANAMDIRKLGCVENDDTQDCGAIINAYLATHPNATIYVPNGIWYTKSTITITGEQNMISDGCIRLGSNYDLTDNTIVALHGSDETISSAMPKNKTFKISVDGNMQTVNGISVQGYYASTFVLSSTRALGIAVRTIARNIENYFNIQFYGGYDNEHAQIGFQIAGGDNDNRADVIGRNATIGVDNHSSYWFFDYIHVWGCAEGVKLYPTTNNIINNFYPDYTLVALTCDNTPSAIVKINNIQSILPKGYYLMGDNTNNKIVLIANQVYIPAGYTQMFKGSPVGVVGNIQITAFNNNKVIEISLDDLNTFTTTQQFVDKYGYIASDEMITGITVKWPKAITGIDFDYDTFKPTQAAMNLTSLKYHISRNNQYLWGRATIYATKRLLNIPAYPQLLLWEIFQNDMPRYYMLSKVGPVQNNMVLKAIELNLITNNTPQPIG